MSINKACELSPFTKQAYFKSRKRTTTKVEQLELATEYIVKRVKELRKDLEKSGGLKMYALLKEELVTEGYKVGRDKFMEILRENDLLIKRKRRYYRTTDSSDWQRQHPNLIKDVVPHRPEQIWVADITYLRTVREGAVYGHFITDAYSKKVVGYHVSTDMKATSTLRALQMAVKQRQYSGSLIHHSDRGSQYISALYTKYVRKSRIGISVTQDGNPYDNAVAERLNGTMKQEFVPDTGLKDIEHARAAISRGVRIYNEKRPHWSNHLLTPNQMHQQQELKIKTWEKKKVVEKSSD